MGYWPTSPPTPGSQGYNGPTFGYRGAPSPQYQGGGGYINSSVISYNPNLWNPSGLQYGVGASGPTNASNPWTAALGFGGGLASSLANQQNAGIAAQMRALEGQLLGGGIAGGGGGGGAGAGIANAIANLQNQQHNLDIGQIQSQLRGIPALTQQATDQYNAQQQALASRLGYETAANKQQVAGFRSDATSRGAMSAPGTGGTFQQLAAQLQGWRGRIGAEQKSNTAQYQGQLGQLYQSIGSLSAQKQKLELQKQIESQQARAAGLGGGGNPFASLANFMRQNAINQQLSGLQSQQVSPFQQTMQAMQYAQLYQQNPQMFQLLMSQIPGLSQFFAGLGSQSTGPQVIQR